MDSAQQMAFCEKFIILKQLSVPMFKLYCVLTGCPISDIPGIAMVILEGE